MIEFMLINALRYRPIMEVFCPDIRLMGYPENYLLSIGDITANKLTVKTEVVDNRNDCGFVWIETRVEGAYFCENPPDRDLWKVIPTLYRQTLHDKPPHSLKEEVVEQHEQMIATLQRDCVYLSILPCQN